MIEHPLTPVEKKILEYLWEEGAISSMRDRLNGIEQDFNFSKAISALGRLFKETGRSEDWARLIHEECRKN